MQGVSNGSALAGFDAVRHPYPPVYADPSFQHVVPTNAWISNLFYPSADNLAPTTTDPYTLRLLDGYGGNPGLTIRHASKKVYGEYPPVNDVPLTEAGYMVNGVVVDFRLTSSEWNAVKPAPLVTSWDHLGAKVRLSTPQNAEQYIEFPLSRGMAYVTGVYHMLTPQFFSQHAILSVETDQPAQGETYTGNKFRVKFNDNPTTTMIIYALGDPLTLQKQGAANLVANKIYNGVIRVAKLPSAKDEAILDKHRAVWPVGGRVSVQTNRTTASYRIMWNTEGEKNVEPLIYAYPHHLQSLNAANVTDLKLESSSKGNMTAVVGNNWTLVEPSLSAVEWLPTQAEPEASTRKEIMDALEQDVNSNYTSQTQKGDNYFSGKGLQKLAMLALVLNKPETQLHNPELAELSLKKLKTAFLPYLENRQEDPFKYDTTYKGIVAKAGLPVEMGGTGDSNAEFGHSYYNDHHYHQGYLIVTAAIIHHLDPRWRANDIQTWTEVLIRDANSPSEDDPHFAPYRTWDWFAGHTWAGGIKINGAMDGRDQESVPESVNFFWGMKLWGLATNNTEFVNLAALQMAIMKRTTYEYFWMLDSNKNWPAKMIKNKVVGIFFEQKIDYTTYFGRYVEFIHGIQQLPMTPALADDIRTIEFVKEEWEQKLVTIAPNVSTPWAGVLYLNYALYNPADAYPKLRTVAVDDGQTRSYSLYIAATRKNFVRRAISKTNQAKPKDVAGHNRLQHAPMKENVRYLDPKKSNHDDRYNGY